MLGWDVFVYRPVAGAKDDRVLLARWSTSVFGLSWIDDLVKQGRAEDLGGDGYPCRYSARADVLLPVLRAGLPRNASPLVIGEEGVSPAGWSGGVEFHEDRVATCPGDVVLLVEAWDQS